MAMDPVGLADRLGHEPGAKLLIVNCDDFGSSHAANLAIMRAMTQGLATSASLMVPCPWAREAARMAAGLPIGIHLTLTSEYRGYRWRPITGGVSLRDQEGFFPAGSRAVLDRMTAAEAMAECRAQVELALGWGVDVTHLDVHMDVLFYREDLFELYIELASECRLPVRLPQDDSAAAQTLQARRRAAARDVLSSEHLIYPWPRSTRDVFFDEVPRLPAGMNEIFAHPALDGEELRGYDPTHASIRTHDAECLMDASVSELLEKYGVKRVSYRELRDLQRGSGL